MNQNTDFIIVCLIVLLSLTMTIFNWFHAKRKRDTVCVIRCKNCKWFNDVGCAIRIVDGSDKPSEDDYCSFAERRDEDD